MTDIEDFVQKDRDFLHDLCNSLAVAQGHLMLINMKMKKDPQNLNYEEIELKITKSLGAIDSMNNLIMARRAVLKSL